MFNDIPQPVESDGGTFFTNFFVVVAVLFCLVMMLRNLLDESDKPDSDRIA